MPYEYRMPDNADSTWRAPESASTGNVSERSNQHNHDAQPALVASAGTDGYTVKVESSGCQTLLGLLCCAVLGVFGLLADTGATGTSTAAKNSAAISATAPKRTGAITDTEAQAYIALYAPVARQEMQRTGVPASIILAQALCESAAGQSGVATKCNNHFGHKCFAKRHRGCCVKFHDDNNGDGFRIYNTIEESYYEHASKLSKGRYKELLQLGPDCNKWAWGLQNRGYATSKTYAKSLIGWINRYRLHEYDHDQY